MTIYKEKFDKFNKLVKSRNLLIVIIILLFVVLFFFILNMANADKINQGTRISGIPVGGLAAYEAEQLLKLKFQEFLNKKFLLNYKKQYWQTSLKQLGADIDIKTTIDIVSAKNNILWQFISLFGYNMNPVKNIDEEKMENFFIENLSTIHQPAINASLIYNQEKEDFIIAQSKQGIVINKNKIKKDLAKNINSFQANDVEISLIKDEPEVIESETEKAKQEIKNILQNLPLAILVENEEIDSVDKEGLLSLIEFDPVLDSENPNNKILGIKISDQKAKEYLIFLSQLVNREPIDAQFTIKDNRVTAFALSEEGIRLEINNNITILSKELLNPSDAKQIQLKINKIQPKITTDSINSLGITTILAKGTSNFSGSPNSRIHNIKIGIAKFNGILIKPDEEFSFNKILGEVGPEQGYKPELVIKKDKTIPEYGGGLCQVSTTMFRAAVNAGLEITQRYPHAFPVKYYNPQGFDATIYPPFPDLKFINNTPKHILIQTKINGYELIFEIYGTNDTRKVEIDGPYQYDIKEDGSMKARLVQKVYDENNNLIIDKTFYSNYKSPDLYPIEKNPLE